MKEDINDCDVSPYSRFRIECIEIYIFFLIVLLSCLNYCISPKNLSSKSWVNKLLAKISYA